MTSQATMPYLGLDEVKGKLASVARSLLAEFLGTMFLVMVGCGSVLGAFAVDIVRVALAFGVTVATMAQSIGHISGCHINPAVTAGLFVGTKIGLVKGLLYVVAQCVGAIVGAGLLRAFVPAQIADLGVTKIHPTLNAGQGFGIEFFITFVLVLVVFASAADENNADAVKGSAPLAIGLSITTCHLFAIPFTGSSMNPARSLGPAVILNSWANHWIYWLGPILGGMAAALVYQLVFKAEPKREYMQAATTELNDEEKA